MLDMWIIVRSLMEIFMMIKNLDKYIEMTVVRRRMTSKRVSKKKFRKPRKTYKRIKNLEKKVTEIKNDEELKWVDTLVNSQPITPNGFLLLLNHVNQGNLAGGVAAVGARIGNVIDCTSLQYRLRIQPSANSTNAVVRVIIFWDIQADQQSPTVAGSSDSLALLDNTAAQVVSTNNFNVYSPYNYNMIEAYRVIYDKLFIINVDNPSAGVYNSTGDSTSGLWIDTGKIKLSRKTKYATTTGTATDINTNALWMCILSDSTANEPVMRGCFRLYFKDD
ncbi:capsid protein [Apis mellifera virus-15]|nr:capsid protein [Apis mellifera virus-15]